MEQVIEHLKFHYSRYFKEIEDNDYIRQIVPLLTAYSLFEYPMQRTRKIMMEGLPAEGVLTVDELEKLGFISIKTKAIPRTGGLNKETSSCFVLEIPFITLHIIYRLAKNILVPTIQFLHSMDSYLSPEECELSTLNIVMFRLWAYHQISGNYQKNEQSYLINRSKLFPLLNYDDRDVSVQSVLTKFQNC